MVDRPNLRIWFSIVLALGLLLFTYHYLAAVTSGHAISPLEPLINELTAAFGAGLLFWGVRALALAKPLERGRIVARIPVYVAALVAYTVLHTSSNWLSRAALYPVAGLGRFDYGEMPLRYFMEFPIDLISFVLMVGAVRWAELRRLERDRENRELRLERSLTEARLANLRLQLQPHFLFNALNTISSVLHRDPDIADELLERLAHLLRGALSSERDDLVPLERELDWLRAYVALLEARFEERLVFEVDVPDDLRRQLLPAMSLQPLVENAVRHGGLEQRGTGRIRVTAEEAEGGRSWQVAVCDDGERFDVEAAGNGGGFGLRSVRERLELLFGGAARLELVGRERGGCRAVLTMPLDPAVPGAAGGVGG